MKISDVALLRPVLSEGFESNENARAVARLKTTDGRNVVNVSVCGLTPKSGGDYYFFLEGNVPPFFQMYDVSGGEFSVYKKDAIGATAIFFVTQKEAFIDLYGSFSINGMTEKEVIDYAQTYFFGDEISGGAKGVHGAEKDEREGREEANGYDDEVIADENYYEYGDVDFVNLKVKNDSGEKIENVGACKSASGGGEKEAGGDCNACDEEKKSCLFFEKIRANLIELFKNYPEEKSLEEMVCKSKWVKVDYNEGKSYVVGIIYDDGKPEFLCYGAPGNYYEKPDELKGYCSFIPSSPFELKKDGYWVMFQSASNGKRL